MDTSESKEMSLSSGWSVVSSGDDASGECELGVKRRKFSSDAKDMQEESYPPSEGSSSSDIEVIDENSEQGKSKSVDEPLSDPSSISAPPSDIMETISLESDLPSQHVEEVAPPIIRRQDNYHPDRLAIAKISCQVSIVLVACVVIANHCYIYQNGPDIIAEKSETISQLKQLIEDLKLENSNLKNQVVSEIQNEKIIALEFHINELKDENGKLTELLQNLVFKLRQQDTDSDYLLKDEIVQLRELVNILQTDKDELQKEMMRLKYGSPVNHKKRKEFDEKYVKNSNKYNPRVNVNGESKVDENTTMMLAEELKKLQQRMVSEFDKLKKWNEIMEVVADHLQKSNDENENWSFNEMKQRFNRAFSEAQENIINTVTNIQNFNISEMFSKYMKYNENTAENIFKSIGDYLKVAQEKTQKLIKDKMSSASKDATIDNVWSAMEKVGQKLTFVTEKLFKTTEEQKKEQEKSSNEAQEKKSQEEHESAKQPTEYFEMPTSFKGAKSEYNSWMFERAAERAKLRHLEEERDEEEESDKRSL